MNYPSVFRRYLSTLLDLLVLWCWIYLVTRFPIFVESNWISTAIIAPAVLAYEPLLTAFHCTIGQRVFRLRVRTFEGGDRISIPQAYGRLFVKYLLGAVSILTIPARADRRAIHDFATETIVIEAAQDRL
jgi:uncharacterized RDD family membrane protein YckC